MKVTLITVGVATSLGSECEVLVSGKLKKTKQSRIIRLLIIMKASRKMNLENNENKKW